MKSFAFAAFAGVATAIKSTELAYMNYLAEFGKNMNSVEEFNTRMNIFDMTSQFIEEINGDDRNTWTAGHNQFSDWTREEYRQLLGYKGGMEMNRVFTKYDESAVPNAVNWVDAGAVTPVKDQGQCGSCWSFSATGAIEGAHQIATGTLLSFSEQQLVSCSTANYGCNGGWQYKAFKYYETHDAELESVYPYTSGRGTVAACQYDSLSKTAVEVSKYAFVTADNATQMKAALATQPLAVSIEADKMVFQTYTSGVLNSTKCGTNLDHAVLAVGYGTENGQDYWLVKNSWNTTWGDKGYIKLAIVDGEGICGVQMEPLTVNTN